MERRKKIIIGKVNATTDVVFNLRLLLQFFLSLQQSFQDLLR
jgi:hypothetical protein